MGSGDLWAGGLGEVVMVSFAKIQCEQKWHLKRKYIPVCVNCLA